MGTGRQPIPSRLQPQFREASELRSDRDSDTVGRQWSKNRVVSQASGSGALALSHVQRQLDRLRVPLQREDPYPALHPFQIYQLPGEEGSNRFRVHGGYVFMRYRWAAFDTPTDYPTNHFKTVEVAGTDGVTESVFGVANHYEVVGNGQERSVSTNVFDLDPGPYDPPDADTPPGGYFYLDVTYDTKAAPSQATAEVKYAVANGPTPETIDVPPRRIIGSVFNQNYTLVATLDPRWRVTQWMRNHDFNDVPLLGETADAWQRTTYEPAGNSYYYDDFRIYYPGDIATYDSGGFTYMIQKTPAGTTSGKDPVGYASHWTTLWKLP